LLKPGLAVILAMIMNGRQREGHVNSYIFSRQQVLMLAIFSSAFAESRATSSELQAYFR